jgi:NAD(P)-dependent dehydrogenase (short-subunit alcohol dehydrogenase family)
MATVLVTGANRGIGLELCKAYAGRGDTVIGACRESSEGLTQANVRIEEDVDVTSDDSVNNLAKRLEGAPIDILINNAGVFSQESLDNMDFDSIRKQLEVNTLGPFRVTLALRPNLGEGSKVAIITSQMGSIEETTSGGYYGYRISKAAVNMVGKCLALELKAKGIAVVLLHPGYVRTDMTKHQGKIGPDESARGLIERINQLSLANTGRFWHQNGRDIAW